MRKIMGSLLLAGLAVAGLSTNAFAKKHHRAHVESVMSSEESGSIPLTVNRRSWLDPGNATSTTNSGGPSYVSANTVFNKTPDQVYAPDKFGNAEFPGAPYVPGRSQPVVEGSSTPYGPVVDNVLMPQNFYFNPSPELP